MSNSEEFVLAYAALCKKHGLCLVATAWEEDLYVEGGLYVEDLDGCEIWVEEVVKSEGREAYEAYQKQVKDGHH